MVTGMNSLCFTSVALALACFATRALGTHTQVPPIDTSSPPFDAQFYDPGHNCSYSYDTYPDPRSFYYFQDRNLNTALFVAPTGQTYLMVRYAFIDTLSYYQCVWQNIASTWTLQSDTGNSCSIASNSGSYVFIISGIQPLKFLIFFTDGFSLRIPCSYYKAPSPPPSPPPPPAVIRNNPTCPATNGNECVTADDTGGVWIEKGIVPEVVVTVQRDGTIRKAYRVDNRCCVGGVWTIVDPSYTSSIGVSHVILVNGNRYKMDTYTTRPNGSVVGSNIFDADGHEYNQLPGVIFACNSRDSGIIKHTYADPAFTAEPYTSQSDITYR